MIEWMELRLPPINLWNAPKMERKKMLTFLPKLPETVEDAALCECQNCGEPLEAWECMAITNFHNRIAVGDIVPAGECPECGGLVYLKTDASHEE